MRREAMIAVLYGAFVGWLIAAVPAAVGRMVRG